MNEIYEKGQPCMLFSNQEILEFLVAPLQNDPRIKIKLLSNEGEIFSDTKENIEYVCFDGDKEDFHVSFYGHQTSIFVLKEEFMFIDDDMKLGYTSSDTYKNIVYEGKLRNSSHEEILKLMHKFVSILKGVQKINVIEHKISQEGFQYPKCEYDIHMIANGFKNYDTQFDNIRFFFS